MSESIEINGRVVSPGPATYVIAKVSTHNNQDLEQAVRIVEAAKPEPTRLNCRPIRPARHKREERFSPHIPALSAPTLPSSCSDDDS
jgi:hypothetical protein